MRLPLLLLPLSLVVFVQSQTYDLVARIGGDNLRLGSLETTEGPQNLEYLDQLPKFAAGLDQVTLQIVPVGWKDTPLTGASTVFNIKDHIRGVDLHLDHAGNVYHFGLRGEEPNPKVALTTSVYVNLLKPIQGDGPILSKKTVQQKKEETEEAEKSFLAKYWHFLLPVVIIVLLGGGGEEEAKPAAK